MKNPQKEAFMLYTVISYHDNDKLDCRTTVSCSVDYKVVLVSYKKYGTLSLDVKCVNSMHNVKIDEWLLKNDYTVD